LVDNARALGFVQVIIKIFHGSRKKDAAVGEDDLSALGEINNLINDVINCDIIILDDRFRNPVNGEHSPFLGCLGKFFTHLLVIALNAKH
jgi:hypothetical protein